MGRGELCPFPQDFDDDDDDGEGFAFLVLKSERKNKKRRKNLGFGASTWGEPGSSESGGQVVLANGASEEVCAPFGWSKCGLMYGFLRREWIQVCNVSRCVCVCPKMEAVLEKG